MSRQYLGNHRIRESDGPCQVCGATNDKYPDFWQIYQKYSFDHPDRNILTFCMPCSVSIFGDTDPAKIMEAYKMQRPIVDSAQYLGFEEGHNIKCKYTGNIIIPAICIVCPYFAHFQYSHLSGIYCMFQTDEDKEEKTRLEKILKLECPDCGGKLQDNTIKSGTHKGHGSIYCPNCKKNLIMI